MKLLVGADPEVNLYDKDKGTFISAHDLVPGTKEKPFKVKKGAVQVDGTALEFNIDPASNRSEFVDNLSTVLDEAKKMLPKGIEIRFDPVVIYDKKYFDKLPKSCKELGCDPDYDCQKGGMNPVPRASGTMRTFGGHLHLGWGKGYKRTDDAHMFDCREMSRRLKFYFDFFTPFWDLDNRRTEMYGNNGAFRPKTYGVEYRSMSNAWLKHPDLWPWVYDSVQWVFKHSLENPYQRVPEGQYYVAAIHPREILGYNKMGQYVYGNSQRDLHLRLADIDGRLRGIFGCTAPEFPKNFKQVEAPASELHTDRYGRPINGGEVRYAR